MSAITKWDDRFLDLAYFVAGWSKDPSTKVGAVIADNQNRIVSIGYNGFPRGVADTPERLNDRAQKYPRVVHGEINAILFAGRPVTGFTLYTVPFMPCSRCAGPVIQAGIKRVVAPFSDNPRWVEDFKLTEEMFEEAGVELVLAVDVEEAPVTNLRVPESFRPEINRCFCGETIEFHDHSRHGS